MLVKLEVDQALRYWTHLKQFVMMSQMTGAKWTPEAESRLVEAAATGALQIWVEVNKDTGHFDAVLSTAFVSDIASGSMGLLIYSLMTINKVDGSRWIEGVETLRKYARSRGCGRITAFSSNPKIIGLINKIGGDTSMTLCTLEV